jgi:hypothetical protein
MVESKAPESDYDPVNYDLGLVDFQTESSRGDAPASAIQAGDKGCFVDVTVGILLEGLPALGVKVAVVEQNNDNTDIVLQVAILSASVSDNTSKYYCLCSVRGQSELSTPTVQGSSGLVTWDCYGSMSGLSCGDSLHFSMWRHDDYFVAVHS